MILFKRVVVVLVCFLTIGIRSTYSQLIKEPCSMSVELLPGQTCIWYLFHSGWAVKTQNYFFIFDYWEHAIKPDKKTLENGYINPEEIADRQVFVFTSHVHSDHFDTVTMNWEKMIPDITYVWGWKNDAKPAAFCFDTVRTKVNIGNIEVYNIHYRFDGIPESAFLIHVDGLWIYHAGDHGHSKGEGNRIFKDNIDYLATLTGELDIMFTPTWGGELYAIEQLSPRAVFPMHDGGYENQYEKFAKKVKTIGLRSQVGAAKIRGDSFFYTKEIKRQNP